VQRIERIAAGGVTLIALLAVASAAQVSVVTEPHGRGSTTAHSRVAAAGPDMWATGNAADPTKLVAA
jgi:hypothetical protein